MFQVQLNHRYAVPSKSQITRSLWGVTGTVTMQRMNDGHFWLKFDAPARGAGSVMTGVWLSARQLDPNDHENEHIRQGHRRR